MLFVLFYVCIYTCKYILKLPIQVRVHTKGVNMVKILLKEPRSDNCIKRKEKVNNSSIFSTFRGNIKDYAVRTTLSLPFLAE